MRRNNMKFSKKGVTLTELLIVIGIIVVLAAVLIPVFTGVMTKTNEQSDEVSAGLYTSVMQQFANEKAGEALLYPNLSTTGADAEYSVLNEKSGHGMFPGFNILEYDNDDDIYDAIRREAVIAIKAFTDVKTLDGYYVQPPTKEHYQYVYYYLTGRVTVEDERTKTPVTKNSLSSGVVNVEDYWVYLSRDGGSGEALNNEVNGTGMVFVQIRQYGTDNLLDGVKVTLRIGSESRVATTGVNGTVGFSDVSLGSVFAEAEKLGAISFPDSRFYNESGCITVKNGGYIGDSASNPYVITLKMGSLGSMGFYKRTHTWNGSSWSVSDAYITDNVLVTSAFAVDTTRTVGVARAETYYTNLSVTSGKQELLTTDGKFLLYGPYNLTVSASGYRNHNEKVTSAVYGLDNLAGDYAGATSPYEYPIIMKKPTGSGKVTGVITWERQQQPLQGTPSFDGSWLAGHENYAVTTRVVMKNNSTGTLYYSPYFAASTTGKYPFTVSNLPDGTYSIYLNTPYGNSSQLVLDELPESVTIDGTDVVINARVYYADVGTGSANVTVTYDDKGGNDPISGATVQFCRLGSVTYSGLTTDDDGKCSMSSLKRGFYQVKVTPPSYIGSETYTYKIFVDGTENLTIRLPIKPITITGTVSGYKSDGTTAMDKSGSFSGLTISFVRYNKNGTKKYSSVSATVTTTGLTAPYTVTLVPGMYKVVTSVTCYKDYSGANTLRNFLSATTFNFSLTVDGANISCHPNAKVEWKQDSSYHWQECSKCGTVFNKKAHTPSAWTASGASGCYRYCTEPNCKRTINPVTAHDYQYTATGSYASTCVKNGNKHYKCSRCGYGKDESIPLTGHSWGAYVADDDTTHTRKCKNAGCSASETHNHSFGDWYWVNHNIEFSESGAYCYSTGCQRSDCLTCGYYKLNYPKVNHSIECFVMRQYVNSSSYLNMPTSYTTAFVVTPSGRVYMQLGTDSNYSGRQVWTPGNPDSGGHGFKSIFTSLDKTRYTKSAIFSNTGYSHYTCCGNTPVINGVTYHCYAPINHEGDPYRTTHQCGCSNKPLGYIKTDAGKEIIPALNPAWEDPYKKQGRK